MARLGFPGIARDLAIAETIFCLVLRLKGRMRVAQDDSKMAASK